MPQSELYFRTNSVFSYYYYYSPSLLGSISLHKSYYCYQKEREEKDGSLRIKCLLVLDKTKLLNL